MLTLPTVRMKIAPIGADNPAFAQLFGHQDQRSISQVHRKIRLLAHQLGHGKSSSVVRGALRFSAVTGSGKRHPCRPAPAMRLCPPRSCLSADLRREINVLFVAGGELLACFDAAYKPCIRQRPKKWRDAASLQIAIRNCHLGDAAPLLHKQHEIEHLSLQVRRQG